MTGTELKELFCESPENCHRELMREYGKYVYAIVFNKLRSWVHRKILRSASVMCLRKYL